jgi:hypothetical protein
VGAAVGAALTLACAYGGLTWTLLLLGVWCLEGDDCDTEPVSTAYGVLTGIVAAIGTAAAAWAVLFGARHAVLARPASGVGRAVGIAVGCLALCVLLGVFAVSV